MSSRRDLPVATVLRDVIAVSVIVLLDVLPFPDEVFRAHGLVFVPALLPALAMPFRRRWPLPVLALALACTAGSAFLGVMSPGALMGVAFASFSVAERSRRAVSVAAIVGTALVVFFVNAVPLGGELFDSRAMQFLLFIVLAGAIGDATRSRRDSAAALRERAERAEQGREEEARRRVAEERVRLARDLHDVVAHQISVISLHAGVASSAIDSRPEEAKRALRSVRSAARAALGDIGTLMGLLRDGEADRDAPRRPQPGLADLDELARVFRRDGLDLDVKVDADLAPLPGSSDLVAYLAVKEGLTNALKHGDGRAQLQVHGRDSVVEILVSNAERAQEAPASPVSGHGLRGVRERVEALHGDVEVERIGEAFRLRVRVPLSEEAAR